MAASGNARLRDILQHTFADPALLDAALTHPSTGDQAGPHRYERLEFLGDRVLGVVIAELLLERFPRESEGSLSKRLVALVRREAIAEVAEGLNLAAHIDAAASAKADAGRARETMLADACEALIGALYLDGGLEAARAFVRRYWLPLVEQARKPPRDPKTALQEWLQGRGLDRPVYTVVAQEGPPHAPVFTVEVSAADDLSASAQAGTKRAAEQAAAETLLAKLENAGE